MIQTFQDRTTSLQSLPEGESLVAMFPRGNGYFIFIGDDTVNHSWSITKKEAMWLRDLLNETL